MGGSKLSERTENEIICSRLLGWVPVPASAHDALGQAWRRAAADPISYEVLRTPHFNRWADAGLILEAFTTRSCEPIVVYDGGGWWHASSDRYSLGVTAQSGPAAVRQAALVFLGLAEN